MTENRNKIADFTERQPYCVVSTVNQASQPESALVAFSQTGQLELIFATNQHSRKCQNLQHNPNVAIVIGWDEDDLTTVQYEGVARIVMADQAAEYAEIHYAKQPGSLKHKNESEQCFVVVTPVWVRMTDYGMSPEEVIEEHFDAD